MPFIKLSSKNQIVLPKEARQAMKVKGGDTLLVVVKGNITLIMPKPKNYVKALKGSGKKVYSKEYLQVERSSW